MLCVAEVLVHFSVVIGYSNSHHMLSFRFDVIRDLSVQMVAIPVRFLLILWGGWLTLSGGAGFCPIRLGR